MKELFKNAIVNNFGRLVAGLLFTLIIGAITSSIIEPVKNVVNQHKTVIGWQQKIDKKLQTIEDSQGQFSTTIKKQSQTDSIVFNEFEKLNKSQQLLQREVAIVQTKLGAIKDELPALHQRFSDIENTVKHAQALNEFTYNYSNTQFNTDSNNYFRPRLFVHNIAYQSSINK